MASTILKCRIAPRPQIGQRVACHTAVKSTAPHERYITVASFKSPPRTKTLARRLPRKPHSNVVSVTEHVVMMILPLVHNYAPAYKQVVDGDWSIAVIANRAHVLEKKHMSRLLPATSGSALCAVQPLRRHASLYDQVGLPADDAVSRAHTGEGRRCCAAPAHDSDCISRRPMVARQQEGAPPSKWRLDEASLSSPQVLSGKGYRAVAGGCSQDAQEGRLYLKDVMC